MKSKFKVSDVPLVGRARTFYPVCQNLNINKELAECVLVAMNVAVRTVEKKVGKKKSKPRY